MFDVRLQSLEIDNIKNVEHGIITMPMFFSDERLSNRAEVLGIYGQNGSGKTAIVDVMQYLQTLMMGLPLSEKLSEYITFGKNEAIIQFIVSISKEIIKTKLLYRKKK